MTDDIRWLQRFQNFEKAFLLLSGALHDTNPDVVHRAGIIQFFEMCFELSWKTMKDFLEEEGFSKVLSPRDSIKLASQNDLISDGHIWLQALEDRNLTAHTYDDATSKKVEDLIRHIYFPMIHELMETLKKRLP